MAKWTHYFMIGLMLLLVGCPRAMTMADAPSRVLGLSGTLRWSEGYSTQADLPLSEIANGATVSLIDPANGQTLATNLSSPDGSFTLSFGTWHPAAEKAYILEAIKGLKVGGEANRAGASASRLRTFIVKQGDAWQSLTAGSLVINRSTTALAVISSLKGLDNAQNLALIGSTTVGNPDIFSAPGAGGISSPEYASVWGLVDTAVSLYQDPVRSIARDAITQQFTRLERAPFIPDFSQQGTDPGQTLVLSGNGFDPVSANNKVFFNGVQAPVGNVTVNATGTRLSVLVPANAQTGVITVQVGNLVTIVAAGTVFKVGGNNVEIFAGNGTPAPGLKAIHWSFVYPSGIATDPAGNTYFSTGHKIIRLAPNGTFSLLGGTEASGFSGDGGPVANAVFNTPETMACDAAGNLYIGDRQNYRIRMVPKTSGTYFGKTIAAGNIDTIVFNGSGATAGDGGPAGSAKVVGAFNFTADGAGNLYVSDTQRHKIRMVPQVTGTYFGKAISAGNIDTIAGTGSSGYTGNGAAAASATLSSPDGIAVDANGNLLIADNGNVRIRMVAKTTGTYFGKTITAGNIDTIAGNGSSGDTGDGGLATSAKLRSQQRLALDTAGNLYIADPLSSRIRVIASATGTYFGKTIQANYIDTLAGDGTSSYGGDGGAATSARVYYPAALAFDTAGNLLFTDKGNHRLRLIAKTSGTYHGKTFGAEWIDTVAGNGFLGSSGDGSPAAYSQLGTPYTAITDAAGNLYITDSGGHRIRMVPKTTGIYFGKAIAAGTIETIVGNGSLGGSGDGGPATEAALSLPAGLAFDAVGNLYIADASTCIVRMVAKVSGTYFGKFIQANHIDTIAGSGSSTYGGDGGPATAAGLVQPFGLVFDADGNLYVSDVLANRVRLVAKVSGTYFGKTISAGNIDTIAGEGTGTFGGDGGPAASAKLYQPYGLALDPGGNLYIADGGNNRVRVVAKSSGTYFGKAIAAGNIDTIAGDGTAAFGGDGGPAASAQLNLPAGVSFGTGGCLYITDANNNRVRVVASVAGTYFGQAVGANAIQTLVGDGTTTGGGSTPRTTGISLPVTTVEDGNGDLFITEAMSNRITRVF